MKKKTLKDYKKEAWKYLSMAIRKEKPICEICGSKESQDVHHIIPRARGNSVYFNPGNLIACCKGCHFGWHNRMSIQEKVKIVKALKPNFHEVEEIKNHHLRFSIPQLQEMIEGYKERIK